MVEFDELMLIVFGEYVKNGYLDSWTAENKDVQRKFDIAELGLVTTEVAEAMEEVRDDDDIKLGLELADIMIRTMNFAKRKGINLQEYIMSKHKVNMRREKLHGRKA